MGSLTLAAAARNLAKQTDENGTYTPISFDSDDAWAPPEMDGGEALDTGIEIPGMTAEEFVSVIIDEPEPLVTHTVLDGLLEGGLWPGMTVVGGVPSIGKSILACQATLNVALSGKDVLYICPDDMERSIHKRCMSCWSVSRRSAAAGTKSFSWSSVAGLMRDIRDRIGKVDHSRHAWEGGDEILRTARAYAADVGERIHVTASMNKTNEIVKTVDTLAEAGKLPSLIVIDYSQQFRSGDESSDGQMSQRMQAVTNDLKEIGLRNEIPVLALTSLTKAAGKGENKEPSLDWFAGSAQFGYDAWAAIVLKYPDDLGPGDIVEIVCLKNKCGSGLKTVTVERDGAHSRLVPPRQPY